MQARLSLHGCNLAFLKHNLGPALIQHSTLYGIRRIIPALNSALHCSWC